MVFDERRRLLELDPFKWQLFVLSNISFIILCVEFTANKPKYWLWAFFWAPMQTELFAFLVVL